MTYDWWLINLVSLLSITGFAITIANYLNVSARQAFLPATVLVMIALFAGGLLNKLAEASLIIFWLGLTLLVLSLTIKKYRETTLEISDIVSFVATLLCFWILASIWLIDFRFLGYDEFTHWALIAKFLIDHHAFPDSSSHIAFMQYPPGTAVIQYFFGKTSNAPEQSVLFGHLTLFFACGLYLTSAAKSNLGRTAILAWVLLTTYILRYDMSFIFVDAMLGAFLGTIFFTAAWSISVEDSRMRAKLIWLIVPVIAYMPLIKHVGLVLGLSAAGSILAIQAVWLVRQRKALATDSNATSLIVGLVVGTFGVIISYWLWKTHYQNLGIADTYKSAISLANATEFFLYPNDPSHIELWRTFLNRMMGGVGIGSAILICWSIFYIHKANRRYLAEMTALFSTVFLGLIGYIALLLISYAFFFVGDERIHMASFERYARSFQLGWFALLIAMPTIPLALNINPSKKMTAAILVVGIIALAVHPLARKSLFLKTHINPTSHDYMMRGDVARLADTLKATLRPEDRAYFFDVSGDGLSWYMLRYETNGANQIGTCWAAPPILADGSIGERNAGCERDLSKISETFDYVIIRNPDENFIQANREIVRLVHTLESMAVYTFTQQPDGSLQLQRVDKQ